MQPAGLALASLLPPVLSDPVMPQAVSEAWGGAAEKNRLQNPGCAVLNQGFWPRQ